MKQFSHQKNITTAQPHYLRDIDADLLSIARIAGSIPTHRAPAPIKRYKFQLSQKHQSFASKFLFEVLASSLAAIVFISLAVWTSTPNQKIFAVKRAAEQARLELIRDPELKASAQLSLVEKRMEEAQAILNSETSDDSDKAAALNEIASQTKNAVETIKVANKSTDSALRQSLDSIALKQEALIASLPAETPNQDEKNADTTPSKTKTAVAEIKQILATVNDQDIVSLPAAGSVTIKGIVSDITINKITVDNKRITVTDKTKIFLKDEKTIVDSIAGMEKKKVTVTAIDQNGLVADKIIILEQPAVKGESTTVKPSAKPAIIKPDDKGATQNQESINESQNKTQAGFIYEDPSPTYIP
jgi:hypothetical protein